jgi:hypothetical protein
VLMTERLGVPAVRSSARCKKERSMGNIKFEGNLRMHYQLRSM